MPFLGSVEGQYGYGRGTQGRNVTPLAGSLSFNGSTAYLVLSPGVTFGAGAYTFECWFYNNTNWDVSNPNIRALIGGGPNGAVGCISLFFNTSSSITTDKYGGGGQRTYTLGSAISLNAWHHFAFVRNASLVETIFLDGVKATSCAGGTSISGGQQVNSLNYDGASKDVAKFYQGQWGGYITNMRIVVGTAVYDPTAASITVPNTGPLTVVNAPNTKYLMLGASVTTDSSSTQTVTNPSNLVTLNSAVPF
jgi:hypothetical protein